MKLAPKLTLALLLGVCSVLGVNAFLQIRREVALFEQETRRDLRLMGRGLAFTLASIWNMEGESSALATLERVNEGESHIRIRWVWLEDTSGEEHAPRAPRAALEPLERNEEVAVLLHSQDGLSRIATYTPLAIHGPRQGALELVKSLEYKRDLIRSSVLRSIVTAALMAAVSGGVAMALGWILVGRPVRRLVEQARRVGAGDLGLRLAFPQRDEVGELAREMNMMCDRLEEANRRATAEAAARIATIEQLRHADRLMTVGKLASGIAHELGTPLNVVSARAKLIATEAIDAREIRENAQIIAEQAERIAQIVRQLLDFARRRTPRKELHDLRRVADQTIALLRPMAEAAHVTVRVEGAPLQADVDPSQLQQALTNLAVNAIQSMPGGGVLAIRVFGRHTAPPPDIAGPDGEYQVIEVQDQGEGITSESRPHIFEPFFTTKEVGKGTGLGLPVTWGIVREHGGWIDVESEPGKGSRFRVFLPRAGEDHGR